MAAHAYKFEMAQYLKKNSYIWFYIMFYVNALIPKCTIVTSFWLSHPSVLMFPIDTNGCEGKQNGGCSQLCLPRPTGSVCRCTVGYKLAKDNKTCAGQFIVTAFILLKGQCHLLCPELANQQFWRLTLLMSALLPINSVLKLDVLFTIWMWCRRNLSN